MRALSSSTVSIALLAAIPVAGLNPWGLSDVHGHLMLYVQVVIDAQPSNLWPFVVK